MKIINNRQPTELPDKIKNIISDSGYKLSQFSICNDFWYIKQKHKWLCFNYWSERGFITIPKHGRIGIHWYDSKEIIKTIAEKIELLTDKDVVIYLEYKQ